MSPLLPSPSLPPHQPPAPTHPSWQIVEAALGHLPFKERTVTTATGAPYVGVEFANKLCGVSVIRSGESMEAALRACCKGIKIGKILVLRHKEGDQGDVIWHKLPTDIAGRHVILMDPILATGNTVSKAIQILKEHGVDEGQIMVLTIIAAPQGIHKVCGNFPRATVITSEVDEGIDEDYQVLPGVWQEDGV